MYFCASPDKPPLTVNYFPRNTIEIASQSQGLSVELALRRTLSLFATMIASIFLCFTAGPTRHPCIKGFRRSFLKAKSMDLVFSLGSENTDTLEKALDAKQYRIKNLVGLLHCTGSFCNGNVDATQSPARVLCSTRGRWC